MIRTTWYIFRYLTRFTIRFPFYSTFNSKPSNKCFSILVWHICSIIVSDSTCSKEISPSFPFRFIHMIRTTWYIFRYLTRFTIRFPFYSTFNSKPSNKCFSILVWHICSIIVSDSTCSKEISPSFPFGFIHLIRGTWYIFRSLTGFTILIPFFQTFNPKPLNKCLSILV